jgi:hypothetical protein
MTGITANSLEIGDIVSFNTYGSVITLVNAKVTSICSPNDLLDKNRAATNYQSMQQYFPSNLRFRNYTSFNYIRLVQEGGTIVEVGIPLIDESTIRKITKDKLVVTIANIEEGDRDLLLQLLADNGWDVVTSSIIK